VTTHLWIAGAQAPGGYGGWAWVAVADGEARGAAGGARRTTARAMALTGLVDGLADLTAPLEIHTTDPALKAFEALRSAGWKTAQGEPLADPELWDALAAAVDKAGGPRFTPGHREGGTFADAWAAFALDVARTKGTFSSPIPKPNLKTFVGKLG
jgi:ribonuclease HI